MGLTNSKNQNTRQTVSNLRKNINKEVNATLQHSKHEYAVL